MRVIPVLDVRGGVAVHARRGERERYRPVSSRLVPGSDPVVLARAYGDRLGLRAVYVADLGAISGGAPDLGLVGRLAEAAPEGVWVDAGARSPAEARRLLEAGAERAVIGLETLADAAELGRIAAALPPDRLLLSLDVRGERVESADPSLAAGPPRAALAAAGEAGFRVAVLLDLARVGSGEGPPLALLRRLRAGVPAVELFAGGGVRGREDLVALAGIGCAGALVATALHEGRISRADLESIAAAGR